MLLKNRCLFVCNENAYPVGDSSFSGSLFYKNMITRILSISPVIPTLHAIKFLILHRIVRTCVYSVFIRKDQNANSISYQEIMIGSINRI